MAKISSLILRKKHYLPVAFLTFINIIGFSILIPVLPFIINKYNGNAITYGVLLAAYPIFQFVGAPLLGSLSDKYGRRPLLLISQAGTFIGWVIFGLAYFMPDIKIFFFSLPLFVIGFSRFVDGITGGNVSVVNAYIADITAREDRTKIFGIMGGIVGLGLIVGPALGGFSYSLFGSYLGPVSIAMLISLCTFILIYFFLPESIPVGGIMGKKDINIYHELNFIKRLLKYRTNNFVFFLLFIRIFLVYAFSSFTSIVVLYVIDKFNLTVQSVGTLFFLIGVFLIFNHVVLVKKVSDIIGSLKTFYIGILLLFLSLLAMGAGFSFNLLAFFVLLYFINLGVSLTYPTFKALITSHVEESQQGEISGIDESILSAGSATAPIITAILYSHLSDYTFLILAGIVLIPHLVVYKRKGHLLLTN